MLDLQVVAGDEEVDGVEMAFHALGIGPIVSTGMFTSFLFEPGFGVVGLARNTVHALGSWNAAVTATTSEDIGMLAAEILFAEPPIVK